VGTIKKVPLPMTGLILGLAALGNLIQSYSGAFRSILGLISGLLLVLIIAKLIAYPAQVKEELTNPVVASVFPTFSMAIMVLSTYLKSFSSSFAFGIWVIGIVLHALLILWFTKQFVLNFNIKKVFPSWYIVFVGIVVGSVTANAHGMENIGQTAFWFGFVAYLILICLILYRVLKVKEMPEPTLPCLTILAAPGSLCLAGYMNSFPEKSIGMVYLLMAFSLIFYIVAIALLPKLLKLKFYPSYSAFTFPMVISGIGIKLANGFLVKSNMAIPFLKYVVNFEELVATVLTLYVLVRYVNFLFPAIISKSAEQRA
jgi:exfoliative toxin A/B